MSEIKKICKTCIHLTDYEKKLAPGLKYCLYYENELQPSTDDSYKLILDDTGKGYKEKKTGGFVLEFDTCKNWNVISDQIITNCRTKLTQTDMDDMTQPIDPK